MYAKSRETRGRLLVEESWNDRVLTIHEVESYENDAILFREDGIQERSSSMQASALTEEMRKEILSRLKKIEGQARGIRGMVEKDGNCTDILVQISALSSAARRLGMVIMEGCMRDCASAIPSMHDEADVKEKVDDMAKAIYRFISMK